MPDGTEKILNQEGETFMAQNAAAATVHSKKPSGSQKPPHASGMSRALVRRETTSAYLFLLPSLFFFIALSSCNRLFLS